MNGASIDVASVATPTLRQYEQNSSHHRLRSVARRRARDRLGHCAVHSAARRAELDVGIVSKQTGRLPSEAGARHQNVTRAPKAGRPQQLLTRTQRRKPN